MKKILFASIIGITVWMNGATGQQRDGKLLRSEPWQPFNAESVKADFFVSPEGNDEWSGTLAAPNETKNDGPFATLQRAQQAVRSLKAKAYLPKEKAIDDRYVGTGYPFGKGKDIVVFIRQGVYPLSAPLIFTAEDGGERVETNLPSGAFEHHHLRDHYVTYAAYPGEKPVLSGATPVKTFIQKGRVWIAPFTGGEPSALIADGRLQILARTPNQGYYTLAGTPRSTSEIPFKPGEIKAWPNMERNRIVILLRWRTAYNAIRHVDEKNHLAALAAPEEGPNGYEGLLVVPPRYFVENIKELLDAPGEWFYDPNHKTISYIPMAGIADPNQAQVSVPQLTQLLQVKGDENRPVRNLRFYGLIFEGAKETFRTYPHYYEATPGCVAITFEYCHGCELADSELRACGGVGMNIGWGCQQTRVFGNRFDGLEQGALAVFGVSDLKNSRLVQVNHETQITHNILSNCGQGGGITLSAFNTLRTTIAHNYFTRSGRPYTLVCGGGGLEGNLSGGFRIEYNHFDDVQTDADDAGVIVVNGMTFNSVVRHNLIHGVERGFFSDNVAFWFDNMSSGWTVENNLYYDLEQGAMKTCGTYLSDNVYQNNFTIEAPEKAPERLIEGAPDFSCSNLQLTLRDQPAPRVIEAGSLLRVSADVYNNGSSGVGPVTLYANRKAAAVKLFPVIRHTQRKITFDFRLTEPGLQQIGIGDCPVSAVTVSGTKPDFLFEDLHLSDERVLAGQLMQISAKVTNLTAAARPIMPSLYVNGNEMESKTVHLGAGESQPVVFAFTPKPGQHTLRIGNSETRTVTVLKCKEVDITRQKLHRYISPKARPAQVVIRQRENQYAITACGWDFYHAEDAYAAAYLKEIKGDFIASVRITAFGDRTNEWFRAGLFVRNDLSQSFDVERGSKGSVLMFATPGRAGIQYDEFGDGCMHKASSENLPEKASPPFWIKLERHGDRFTGAVSVDGKNWIVQRRSGDIPGLHQALDLGLAAGSPDQKPYTVEFSDWKILVEEK